MKIKYFFFTGIILLCSLFLSCENIMEFKGKVTDPLLVLNGFLTPDSVVKVHLTESKFFVEYGNDFPVVEDAKVYIWKDETESTELLYTGNGYYMASFKPEVNTSYKITASHSKLGDIKSDTYMIPAVPLSIEEIIYGTREHIYSYGYNDIWEEYTSQADYCDVTLKFTDPAESKDFYRLVVKLINYYDDGSTDEMILFFSLDRMTNGDLYDVDLFNGYQEVNLSNAFADQFINGKEIIFKTTVTYYTHIPEDMKNSMYGPQYPYAPDDRKILKQDFVADLQSITEPYYLYLKSRNLSKSSEGSAGLFSEPIQVYNNIEGGIGIFVGYGSSVQKFQLKEIEYSAE